MRKFLIVLSLWLVPIVAVGATLQRSTLLPEQNTEFFKVSGIVVDEITGQPLSGVKVSLAGCPGAVGLTRTNGSFAILNVPPDVYTLRYVKDGYEIREDSVTVNNDLNVNATLTPFSLPPPPSGATITGKVTDVKTGAPIVGATVVLEGLTSTTGSDGAYSFSIKVGSYTMSVSMIGYETKTVPVNAAEEKTYTIDISLAPIPPPPAGSTIITGKVTDAKTGLPVAGATVKINGYQATTGSNGVYSLNVSEGTYTLMVSMTGYETKTVSVNAPEKKTYTVDVSLTPPSAPPIIQVGFDPWQIIMQEKATYVGSTKVTAVVTRPDGTPVSGVTVSFNIIDQPYWLQATLDSPTAVTDGTGVTSVQLTCTARWERSRSLMGTWPLKITVSATVEGQSIQNSEYINVNLPCQLCH